jgi:peptidylprolyl isomerase
MRIASTLFALALPVLLLLSACGGGESEELIQSPRTQNSPSATSDTTERTPTPMSNNKQYSSPEQVIDQGASYTATIDTNYGQIEVELFDDEAPLAVNSFVFLARDGYFDGVPFHRIVKGFVIQSGDPTGTGTGGPGYRFNDEPVTRNYEPGTLAMANSGPNTNGSQFFITLADLNTRLPKNYTIFGKVTGGMDVVNEIGNVPVSLSPRGEPSVPTVEVHINTVTINETTS